LGLLSVQVITEVILAPFCLSSLIAKYNKAVKFDVKTTFESLVSPDDQTPSPKIFQSTMIEYA